ncbi:hypothetical protein B566_EDAN008614 [Ephemera danica]|nr:hypothetical protein B566_EDAN008614 [Ephemera danica]
MDTAVDALASLKDRVCINEVWIKKRAAELQKANLIGDERRAAWLLRAVSLIDLTTLGGDDCESNVVRLCHKAAKPVSTEVVQRLIGSRNFNLQTGAVCVYPAMVPHAYKTLKAMDSSIPVASVAAGFPSGLFPLETRLREIELAVASGASEIDIVVERNLVITHNWKQLYEDTRKMKQACGDAHLKTILAVGELGCYENIYKASMVTMMAGSDFIKTSTGKEAVNATLPFGLVMCRAIRDFYALTGRKVGLKPAGGLRTAQDGIIWMIMVHEELGTDWLNSGLFRIGASALLGNIERVLLELAYGQKEFANIPVPVV